MLTFMLNGYNFPKFMINNHCQQKKKKTFDKKLKFRVKIILNNTVLAFFFSFPFDPNFETYIFSL